MGWNTHWAYLLKMSVYHRQATNFTLMHTFKHWLYWQMILKVMFINTSRVCYMNQLFADVPSFHHGHKGFPCILQALRYSFTELQNKAAQCKLSTSTATLRMLSNIWYINLLKCNTTSSLNFTALLKVCVYRYEHHSEWFQFSCISNFLKHFFNYNVKFCTHV